MEKLRFKLLLNKAHIALFFALLQILPVLGQEWKLGELKFVQAASKKTLKAGITGGSYALSFLGSVGGVDFQSIAEPASSFEFDSLFISYNPANKDTKRLEIWIDGNTYRPFLPDWQLIPIAEYSNSENTAVVTLFGRNAVASGYYSGDSNEDYDEILYHEAFKDELLGMRLLQADMLLIDALEYWQLPTLGGQVKLGVGEARYTQEKMLSMQENAEIVDELFLDAVLETGETPDSWVYSDKGNSVTFSVKNGKFAVKGLPYHYFWEQDVFSGEAHFLTELTKTMKKHIGKVYRMNPYVFNATAFTAQYSAFFRYVKSNYPKTWETFIYQIYTSNYRSDIKTPGARKL